MKMKALKVSELIEILSKFPPESEIHVSSVVDVDMLPLSEDWSEDENFRDIEAPVYDVSINDKEKTTIWF